MGATRKIRTDSTFSGVMAGLDPAINVVLPAAHDDVDARIKSGHDGREVSSSNAL
jgi:hypothetical protein